MKKLKLVGFILLITIVILNVFSVLSFATSNDPINDPLYWRPGGTSDDGVLNEKIGVILGVIQVVGVVVSVIVLMVIGIKYMLGSAEEKAINKKALIPYLVGAVMVFSVTTIPNFIYQLTDYLLPSCEHEWNTYNGVCKLCGKKCSHYMVVSDISGEKYCDICGWYCHHEYKYENGKHICENCDKEGPVDHSWEKEEHHHICVLCTLREEHDNYSGQGTCSICGFTY